ncbi:hypothetical protein Tco_0538185 [Tanacetum coccineum]
MGLLRSTGSRGAKLQKWCHVSKMEFGTRNAMAPEFSGSGSTSGVGRHRLHLRYLRLQGGAIVARNVVGKCKHYCPPPFGTNKIIPIKDAADVSCVSGSTTDRDPISNKRKTDDGNSTTASDDSKEYDEPASKKRKTVDHNVCELSEDLKRELSKLYRVPLQDEDWTSWLEFTNHAKRASALREVSKMLIEQEKKSIGIDHPFVRVIGEFAVATFNKLCEMLVKKGDHNNIRDFEIMECQYLHMRVPRHYFIYMTIEAFEKGKLGVYEAKIVCNTDDGRRTLTKFVLTDRRPVGM